jgi:hypothetical protein
LQLKTSQNVTYYFNSDALQKQNRNTKTN